MRETTSEAPTARAAGWRRDRAVRLIAAGVVLAAVIAGAGRALVAWRLGDDADIRAGLERDARRHVGFLIENLQRLAATLARQPEVRAGLHDQLETPRRLFAAIDTALDSAADGPALTIYGVGGQPLAWAGRPSELPPDRVLDGANLFVAQAALGLRLVAVEPIADSPPSARRLGTVAAEARLSAPEASRQGEETYVVETAFGPVTLQKVVRQPRSSASNGFVIAGSERAPLLEATIAPDAATAARARVAGPGAGLALATLPADAGGLRRRSSSSNATSAVCRAPVPPPPALALAIVAAGVGGRHVRPVARRRTIAGGFGLERLRRRRHVSRRPRRDGPRAAHPP